MCLRARDYKVYRAVEPILVLKRGQLLQGAVGIKPTFRNFEYIFGQMYASYIKNGGAGYFSGDVQEALHSWRAYKPGWRHSSDDTFPAIIPEGALFVVGTRGDIASSHLIVYNRGAKRPRAWRLNPKRPHKEVHEFRRNRLHIPYVEPAR